MKYGLPELPEEDDLTDFHREAHGKGVSWGCSWLNGFLESLNAKEDSKCLVLSQNPGECEFCDFVFAVKNRICAVVFDINLWGQHTLTYKRRLKLIEASLEHRLMPIVVNIIGGPCPNGSCGFEISKGEYWMTDPIAGVPILPHMGLGSGDDEMCYPLDEWAAELYAKRAAKLGLEEKGFTIVQMYPNNRFFWAKDQNGYPTWVLLSFHHLAIKGTPDYSDFDKSDSCVAGKAGYGVDVAISNNNDESLTEVGCLKVVYRSSNIVASVVAIKKLADGIKIEDESRVSIGASIEGIKRSSASRDTKVEDDDDPFDGYGLPKKKTVSAKIDGGEQQRERWCQEHKIDYPRPATKKVYTKEMLANMPPKEKLAAGIGIIKKKLLANPSDEKSKALLAKCEALLSAMAGGQPQ